MKTNAAHSAVVFDIGGVLIDWDPRHLYRKIFDDEAEMEYFLREICTPAWNRQLDAGASFAEIVPPLCEQWPDHSTAIRAYETRWDEMLGGAIANGVAVLEAVRNIGRPVYALTNWSAETFPIAVERFEFLDWFDAILVSGRVGLAKPDPAIYHRLIETTGLDPASSIFIDDAPANVAAALDAGFGAAVGFTDGKALSAEVAKRKDTRHCVDAVPQCLALLARPGLHKGQ